MAEFNKSNPTIGESLLPWEIKKICRVFGKPWTKNNNYLVIIGLGLLTGINSVIGKEQGLSPSRVSVIKNKYLTINRQGNRLNIEASQVTWQELLTRLKEKADINIQSAIPLQSMVTVSIPSQPVTEALQQLFNHRFDFVFLFSDQNPKFSAVPKTVWLLGNENEQAASLGIKTIPAKLTPDPNLYETEGTKSVQKLVDQARNEGNPELRLQALASLSGQGQLDKNAAKLALEAALDDKDASVRGYAVQALASQDGQAATEYLRAALDDPDAGVRIKAVESAALEGQGIDLLQDALTNPDELIQTIAEERLKQVNK
jgi:hypothetical protein